MTSGPDVLVADLKAIFASRLQAVVLYGPHAIGPKSGHPVHTLVVVRDLGLGDLEAAARRMGAWRQAGLAVPLLMAADEFASSMDAFPVEIGAILGGYRVLYGVESVRRRRGRPVRSPAGVRGRGARAPAAPAGRLHRGGGPSRRRRPARGGLGAGAAYAARDAGAARRRARADALGLRGQPSWTAPRADDCRGASRPSTGRSRSSDPARGLRRVPGGRHRRSSTYVDGWAS